MLHDFIDNMASSNENKISDGYRHRALIEVNVSQLSQNVNSCRVAVTCIAWLGLSLCKLKIVIPKGSFNVGL